MGVDITFFAKNAKRRIHLDRAWIFDYHTYEIATLVEFLKNAQSSSRGVLLFEIEKFLPILQKYQLKDRPEKARYIRYWIKQARNFARRYPSDIFYLMNDHSSEYSETLGDYENELEVMGDK